MKLLHSIFMSIPGEGIMWAGLFYSQLINALSGIISMSYVFVLLFTFEAVTKMMICVS